MSLVRGDKIMIDKKVDIEKCYNILDKCKEEIKVVMDECTGKDGNSAWLALKLMRDIDRLKRCMSITTK